MAGDSDNMPRRPGQPIASTADRGMWVRGGLRLAADAFVGAVDIVNGVHQAVTQSVSRIAPAARPIGYGSDFVYGRVRDIGRLTFLGARQATGLVESALPASRSDIPEQLALGLHSALNGAFGDYLERSGNELALPMQLVDADGHTIEPSREALADLPSANSRVVLLIHGLGLNERHWRKNGEPDYGDRLVREFGYSAIRLRYNSGRHISENGRDLDRLLEAFVAAYPVAIERLTIIGHSMGGLIGRSACYYAQQHEHCWVERLYDFILLGSPHLGSPLERLGNDVTLTLKRLSYTRPFSSIGDIRSAGVKDLRYGHLRDEDWQADDEAERTGKRSEAGQSLPGLDDVGYFLVAATLGRRKDDPMGHWLGDMLVPVSSAFGETELPGRRFAARDVDGRVFYRMNHFALLHHRDVYQAISEWLAPRLDAASAA